jgi:hypothetical protein
MMFFFCVAFFVNVDWFMQRGQTPMFAREIIYSRISTYKNATTWVLSMNFHQIHASPWLRGWHSRRIRSCCVLSAFIINKCKTMESKGCKWFTTTEAEIEEKRLQLNAERTIKQNKASENGKNIAYNYTVMYHVCSVIYYARYLNWGIMSPMAIGWLF